MSPPFLKAKIEEKQRFLDFKNECKHSFDYFFDKYYQGLCVYAFRLLKSNSAAEDLVQDFFVSLLENRKAIQITGSVKSYFLRSVHNRCLDHITHQKVVALHENYQLRMMTEDDFQQYPLLDDELQHKIDQAIQNLPLVIRETFKLNRMDGLSYQEIARQENISVKTVEYRISKALGILRHELGNYLPLLIFISKL